MNNHQITAVLKSHPKTKKLFKGVYSADNVPVNRIEEPTVYVVNTDKSNEIGEHWTAVYLSHCELPEYFDSYGRCATLPRLNQLLGNEYIHNNVQLQSLFTTTCGQHVIYYVLCKSLQHDMLTIINSYPGDPLANDIFVNKIVETAFAIDLKIINSTFLHKQISRAKIPSWQQIL